MTDEDARKFAREMVADMGTWREDEGQRMCAFLKRACGLEFCVERVAPDETWEKGWFRIVERV